MNRLSGSQKLSHRFPRACSRSFGQLVSPTPLAHIRTPVVSSPRPPWAPHINPGTPSSPFPASPTWRAPGVPGVWHQLCRAAHGPQQLLSVLPLPHLPHYPPPELSIVPDQCSAQETLAPFAAPGSTVSLRSLNLVTRSLVEVKPGMCVLLSLAYLARRHAFRCTRSERGADFPSSLTLIILYLMDPLHFVVEVLGPWLALAVVTRCADLTRDPVRPLASLPGGAVGVRLLGQTASCG